MPIKAPAFAFLAVLLVAAPTLAAGGPAAAKKAAADKAAADKAAADKAAADKADADKAAADKAAADKTAADKADADKADADKATADKAAADKAAADKAAAPDPLDPWEDPFKTYRFIGLRYRDAVVPSFLLHAFAAGGRNVNIPMVGPEFTSRKDNLELIASIMYADYSMSPTIFRSKGNPQTSNELVESHLKLIYATLDILREIPLERSGDKTGRIALLIGGGVGFAGVAGDLYRSKAYPVGTPDDNVPGNWAPCTGLNTGVGKNSAGKTVSPPPGYCQGPHFSPSGNVSGPGSYNEPSWTGGGSKPLLFPWIALPQISFRYKPIKQLQLRADLGFSTSGIYFGLSGSYGL